MEIDAQDSEVAVSRAKDSWQHLQELVTTGVQTGGSAVGTLVDGLSTWGRKIQQALIIVGAGGSGSGSVTGLTEQVSPYTGKTATQAAQGGAHGMLITEPILGIGQKSGKGYKFGEAGAERVVSSTGGYGGGGENLMVTFNVYGVTDAMDMESKVKPMFMRWLKESTSMRGIV